MRLNNIVLFLAMTAFAGILWCSEAKPLVLSQAIDILDTSNHTLPELGCDAGYMTKEHLRKRVKDAYDAGIRKLYFRATGGVVYYPGSKLRKMYKGISPSHEVGARTFAEYDILAEYIRVAHEFGMKLYYWEPVFDCYGEYHYPQGSEACAKYGEWPFRDTSIPDELHAEHRFAKRPVENLKRPIRKIVLHTKNVPAVKAEELEMLVAPHGGDFTPYGKPFTVTVTPVKDKDYAADFVIDGLELTTPCIKLINNSAEAKISVFPDQPGSITAEYDNGEPVGLFTMGEFLLFGDVDTRRVQRGIGGFQYGFGGRSWCGPITFIIRFGDFTRHAIGMPEYAFKENRDRMNAIVTELYDMYPELDGVAFSIRTHTLPAGGNKEMVGSNIIYGYSDPVVKEFIRRYGVNPREEPFDEDLFQKLRGEYFTMMLEGVAKIVHARGGKLECMAPVRGAGSIAHGSMYPWWGTTSIDNFFDIRTWARKGIVDNVIMLGTQHRQEAWGPEWQESVRRFAEHLEGTGTRLTMHLLVNGSTPEILGRLIPPMFKEEKLDEVEAYEEWNMQIQKLYGPYVEAVKASGRAIAK